MRFGNASTTVTGTVTPASVNTRVMPHLRPTRPMAIVKILRREGFDWLPQSLQSAGGLGNGPQLPLGNWRRAHALRPLKLDGGLYMNSPAVQVSVQISVGPGCMELGDRKPEGNDKDKKVQLPSGFLSPSPLTRWAALHQVPEERPTGTPRSGGISRARRPSPPPAANLTSGSAWFGPP